MPNDAISEQPRYSEPEEGRSAHVAERKGPNGEASRPVLVLGGSEGARDICAMLVQHNIPVIYSLAGVTERPRLPAGDIAVRIGGFGGASGLKRYLSEHAIAAVIDATHPFATGMQAKAAKACADLSLPIARLHRLPWRPKRGDRWIEVAHIGAAAKALPKSARVFAALGARGLRDLEARGDLHLTARMLTRPDWPLPPRWRILLSGPRKTVAEEAVLLSSLRTEWLICRNAGGQAGRYRLKAARLLNLPVVMIRQPPPVADVPRFFHAPALLAWVLRRIGQG